MTSSKHKVELHEDIYPEHNQNEINLFDLWAILMRRKLQLVLVALLVFGLAIAYSLIREQKYKYWMTVQIGSRFIADELQPIEPASSAAVKLNENYIPRAIQAWCDKNPKVGWRPKLTANAPKDSDIVNITGAAPSSYQNTYFELLKACVDYLQRDHQRIIDTLRDHLKIKIDQIRNELATLKSELEVSDIAEKRREINHQESKLEALESRLINIVETRPLSSPQKSFEPQGTGGVTIVCLGLVIGIIVGILFAFTAEFIKLANEYARLK